LLWELKMAIRGVPRAGQGTAGTPAGRGNGPEPSTYTPASRCDGAHRIRFVASTWRILLSRGRVCSGCGAGRPPDPVAAREVEQGHHLQHPVVVAVLSGRHRQVPQGAHETEPARAGGRGWGGGVPRRRGRGAAAAEALSV